MAFAVVQKQISADGTSATSTSISVAVTAITAGNAIIGTAMYSFASKPATVTVTCGSDTLTVQDHVYNTTTTNGLVTFAKANAIGGGTTLTVTFGSNSCTFRRIMMVEVSGGATAVDQHTLTSRPNSTTGTDLTSATITPSQSGDFLYAMAADIAGGNSVTWTVAAGSGYTLQNNATGPNNAMVDGIQTYNSVAAKAGSFHFVGTTEDYIVGIIALSPPVGGDIFMGQIWL